MIVSIHQVSATGAIELVAANVPYASLQWTRKMSNCGEFEIQLIGELPVEWPGRYLVTVDGQPEAAIIEKATYSGGTSPKVTIAGRMALSLWDNWCAGTGGATVSGANWRQATTQALNTWHMSDIPPLTLGAGTKGKSGSSYELSLGEGDSAMDSILSAVSANGSWACVAYNRDTDPTHLVVSIVDGLNRCRSQSDNSIQVFSLSLGNVSDISYSGDYSSACTEVLAYASKGTDETAVIEQTVAVPDSDISTQWARRAYEDVSSLIDEDATPTDALVKTAGTLRCYDHMSEVAIDATVYGTGYQSDWDLGDLCEVEVAALGLVAQERIEEVRIVDEGSGVTVEATLGTKQISRIARALIGRR